MPSSSISQPETGRAVGRAKLISFSGIDGAGKSTQIANLRSRLEEAGLRVELITFWDDVATLRSVRESASLRIFRGDRGVGTPEKPIERRDKNIRSPLMTPVRLAMYLLDALSLRRIARRALRSGADIVIFDRYLYDELANLDLDSPLIHLYIRCVMALVPRPRPGFVLDADPAQARARKPEYPLGFLQACRNSYLRLSALLGFLTVIPPGGVETTGREVLRRVSGESGGPDRTPAEFAAQTKVDGREARPLIL